MSTAKSSPVFDYIGNPSELALVGLMVGILLVLFTPIPSGLLDFLLITNISFGLMILLLTFFMDKPLAFSTFPSLLLIATLFRLSLNIAATRLILDDANAGYVINAVGHYVVAGNYVIGLVVFLILIVVQYVVVTNGAQRVAEVAARFTLDSMPGKQMSIDADLNMGLIDDKEARIRRRQVEQEANFYGSMDGASKFVKGDAIAGIIIILIDIVGGLTIGVAQHSMGWAEALHTYTLLTVGDGIVTQIPALVISTATGIIVTRAATDAQLGEEIASQVTRYPKSLFILAIALSLLLLLPGIPAFPVLLVLAAVITIAVFATRKFRESRKEVSQEDDSVSEELKEQDIYQDIAIEPIEIELGESLLISIGEEKGAFMTKVKAFRKQYALDQGFVFPSVKLRDNRSLHANEYCVRINNSRVADNHLYMDKLLAISAKPLPDVVKGLATADPTYQLPAKWIDPADADLAKEHGATIVEPVTVLFTHFSELIKRYSAELLSRYETDNILKRVRVSQPNLMDELLPNVLTTGDIQKILQLLLKEKVSIRNVDRICECLLDKGRANKDIDYLAEQVRVVLGRNICENLVDEKGELHVLSLEPALEQVLQAGLRAVDNQTSLLVDPRVSENLFTAINKQAEKVMRDNYQPVLICSSNLRRHIRKMTERFLAHVAILSMNEVPNDISVVSAGIVRVDKEILDANRVTHRPHSPSQSLAPQSSAPQSPAPQQVLQVAKGDLNNA